MTNDEVEYFRQAEQFANSGQMQVAHQMFCALRDHGNSEVEIFFWIATTSTNPFEARRAIETAKRLQPYHPRLPALEAFNAKKQRYAMSTRIVSALYLFSVAFIVIRDIPRGTVSTLNTLVILYVVLCNTVLSVNIARLAMKRVVFTKLSALYIAALVGLIMAVVIRNAGASLAVARWSLLYIAVYTVTLAIRGAVRGKI